MFFQIKLSQRDHPNKSQSCGIRVTSTMSQRRLNKTVIYTRPHRYILIASVDAKHKTKNVVDGRQPSTWLP